MRNRFNDEIQRWLAEFPVGNNVKEECFILLNKVILFFWIYDCWQQEPVVTPYSNPELNLISQDIDELVKEKQLLEGEILQKESEIKIKVSEASSLQASNLFFSF